MELATVQAPMARQMGEGDALLVLARGMGMHRLMLNMLRIHCDNVDGHCSVPSRAHHRGVLRSGAHIHLPERR